MKKGLPWHGGIPRPVKAAFLCGTGTGYAVHLFAFTNIIPNADGLSRVSDAQQMTAAGRWFLHYATTFNGFIQSPAVIGFFTVLFLSLAAALTVSLLRIENPLLGGLTGVLMTAFPAVAFTLLYLFTASAYSFGILLAVLAVYLTARSAKGLFPGALLLACAVGTYQAYYAVAVSLSLISVLLLALENQGDGKALRRFALRQLGLLVLGLGLYFAELYLFLRAKDLTLMSYKGIGELGQASFLSKVFSRLGAAYTSLPETYDSPFAVCVNAVLAAAGLWALIRLVKRGALFRRPGRLVFTLALCALLPLALNLPALMADRVMEQMRYAFVFWYVLILALTDRALRPAPAPEGGEAGNEEEPRPAMSRSARILLGAAVGASVLLAGFCLNIDNLAYTASATAHRATLSFATRLVERVESTPGYRSGMEVVIVGGFPEAPYHSGVAAFDLVDAPSDSVLSRNKHVYYYLNDWLNVPWEEPDEKTFLSVSGSEAFQDMRLYPDEGSVVIEDGRVIVKLAWEYTPKKEYELQYENRK